MDEWRGASTLITALGRFGFAARAIVLVMIGLFLVFAAVTIPCFAGTFACLRFRNSLLPRSGNLPASL